MLAAVALVLPAWAAGTGSASPAEAAGVDLALTGVTPAVARAGQDLVVTGTLHNDGSAALNRPTVAVVMPTTGTLLRSTREAVHAWAAATGPSQGKVVGQTRLPTSVAPGDTATFSVTVPRLASLGRAAYGAIPLSVQTGTTSVRTFAGYQRTKQYQPMSISWAVPLTLDPDPALFGGRGASREAAWAQTLADGSRVNRILDATQDAPVTWAIDPSLTPGMLPEGVDIGDGSTQGDQETAMRAATQGRIAAAAPRHTPWVLPDTDADLAAVAGASTGQSLMRTLVGRSQAVAAKLGGRSDVAWPADGGYTATRETALRRLFRAPTLAGQVTSAAVLSTSGATITPGAAQRSTTGLPLLAYDDALSALLTRTTSPSEGVLSTQQFVADSVALLNELPGTEGRSLFVAAPRSFNPDPDTARAFFAAAGSIPWLTPTTTDAVLGTARRVAGTPAAPVTRPAIPATGGRAVLTSARIRQLEQTVRTVRGVAQIRDDGNEFLRTWTRAAEQLASTRWRAAPTAWNTLSGRVSEAAKQTTTAVKVSASTINFLADSGRLQITVTNDLAVPVEDVKLTVEASNPRLRIDSQPPILRIGPKSKATVSVRVTALAAGSVPLRTTLTTPDGTVIGQGADVQVRVTPTGNWVYWGLAALGGLILLLGIVRTVRRRPGSGTALPREAPPA
ncbi:hypothetical protein EAH86_10020 [Pedococcus bigeumensis]|uniref:Glycoprotein n=1 Tax=Pedococcus bigeumensis TaxID=433644 RepID=A0A502CX39_9MICO|nr:hypothetical protein EAH86_10020 [Pedococcus bigeumensis]